MINKVDFLTKVSLFSHMKEPDIHRIAELVHYHLFHDGDLIIREGDRDRRLFIIVKGKAEVIKNLGEKDEKRVRPLGPYSYFGEMSLIDDLARSASVVDPLLSSTGPAPGDQEIPCHGLRVAQGVESAHPSH